MNRKLIIGLYTLVCSFTQFKLYCQADTATQQFTLQAAIDFALKHNYTYMNVENDSKLNNYKKMKL